ATHHAFHRPCPIDEADTRGRDHGGIYAGRSHHRSCRYLSPLLPRTGVPGSRTGVVGWESDCRVDGERPSEQSPSRELTTLMAPRLIELCFQTAGIWEMGAQSRMGLPQHIDRVSLLRSPDLAEGRLYAMVTPNQAQGSFDAEVVDAAGNRFVQLSGYRTVAVPNSIVGEPL